MFERPQSGERAVLVHASPDGLPEESEREEFSELARSAGASVQLVAREGQYATLRLRSGEMRKVLADCIATIGEVGNVEHSLRSLGKAGAARCARCTARNRRACHRCRR